MNNDISNDTEHRDYKGATSCKIFAGTSHPQLAEKFASEMGAPMAVVSSRIYAGSKGVQL